MFVKKTQAEIDKMSAEEYDVYLADKEAHDLEVLKEAVRLEVEKLEKDGVSKEEVEALKTKSQEQVKALETQGLELKALRERVAGGFGKGTEKQSLKSYLETNSEVFKSIKENAQNQKLVSDGLVKVNESITKAFQNATDIGQRDDYAEFDNTTERKPVRETTLLNLFRTKKVSKEQLKYREENVVTRDAKFVIACATSTHNTKKTWINRTVELAKIRDMVDICIDMLEDYDFVESELKELVNESIYLTAEFELLNGASALATDMLSIDFISSEFNPANPLAYFSGKFQNATIGDLTSAMKAQIYTFGQQRKFMADTVLMNYTDMITYLHAKDANNNYLFPNFVMGATNVVNGMRIVTSPLVAQNELFVFDSKKGEILERRLPQIVASYENKDNIEHEIVTFVAYARLQFHVKLINRDAFMKCTDIAGAITDITTQ